MKSNILKTAMAVLALAIMPASLAVAGIDSEFETPIISQENYQTLSAGFGVTRLDASQFTDNFNNVNRDDGYARVNLPFTFNFNSVDRTQIWICVNGFITFNAPLNLPQDDQTKLFVNQPNSFQNNVVAPFWGDHYYRTVADVGYTRSDIFTSYDQANERFIIEWKNLNINDESEPSSIGSFQVILYKSNNPNTRQGNIEFAYGLVNGSGGAIVKTDGASIGIKGESGEYINGLCYDTDPNDNQFPNCDPFGTQELSNVWQPSGGTNFRILFTAYPLSTLLESWGDGDTDLSHGEFGMHFGMPQNRFVTFNDVRRIMRSVVTGVPLDSVRGREAYHADVDHDGRFWSVDTVVWRTNAQGFFVNEFGVPLYYNSDTVTVDGFIQSVSHTFYTVSGKTPGTEYNPLTINDPDFAVVLVNTKTRGDIPQRSSFWAADLPNKVTALNQVHFQADEHDAYWIVDYLAVHIPSLPWIYEWKDKKGKLTFDEKLADDIKFGEAIKQGQNRYKIPVYANGLTPEGFSTVFNFDTDVEQVEINSELNNEVEIYADFHNNKSVIVGSGLIKADEPYAYIYVNTDKDVINVSGLKYNDKETANTTIRLNNNTNVEKVIDVYPNPAIIGENAKISINVENSDYYTLEVYDVFGSLVATIYNGELNNGTTDFNWNGIDNTGREVTNGTYIVRLSNQNFNAVSKIILNR